MREDVGGNGVKKYPLDKFVPERFMEGDLYYDPYEYSFGFGRRFVFPPPFLSWLTILTYNYNYE